MINADEEISLAYLLDPSFQLVNTAGKPLTDGWLEVYIHGTRSKYYCYSDWNGSLHPFKIPLDSLGSNVVLASPAHSYDIYIYNKYGTLVMSRYNVVPSTGDGTVIKAGNCIDVSKNDNNVTISFDVAAGITDIELVESLPAEPLSTVLYLIPENR